MVQLNNKLLLLSLCLWIATLAAPAARVVELAQADSMRSAQVIYNGRICPLNTAARQFCLKITGSSSFGNLTPEQVLLSWALYPEEWKDVAMIKVKKSEVRRLIGIDGKYARFADFFDSKGNYKLAPEQFPDIDERLSLIVLATRGEYYTPLPEGQKPLSSSRVKAELLYNSVPWDTVLFIACFTLVIFLLFPFHSSLLTPHSSRLTLLFSLITLLFSLFSLCLRWYVARHLPLSNTYETLQVIALTSLVIATCSARLRMPALLVAGATSLVAHIGALDPQITALVPVLQSPWLSSHVTTIMISYSLFALLLFRPSRTMLLWAEIMLGIGIILGSIWAKTAWGAYWQWDPKENWAAISFLIYLVPLLSRKIQTGKFSMFNVQCSTFNFYLRVAFLSILMTYFGCNYLLGGLHSYAN
ncbi:MAG: cytochrome c biogenesis protein CcsA [Bacteroidaceae bacterium]|nr:cytochrome c biogenesis protein CcsA [Bacteroidaceae bacterium]